MKVYTLKVLTLLFESIALTITAVHVLLIHSKFHVVHGIVLNDREHIERVFLILALVFYGLGFMTGYLALVHEQKQNHLILKRLEDRLHVKLENTHKFHLFSNIGSKKTEE